MKRIYIGQCSYPHEIFTVCTGYDRETVMQETIADRKHLTELERKKAEHWVEGWDVPDDFDPRYDDLPDGDPEEWHEVKPTTFMVAGFDEYRSYVHIVDRSDPYNGYDIDVSSAYYTDEDGWDELDEDKAKSIMDQFIYELYGEDWAIVEW